MIDRVLDGSSRPEVIFQKVVRKISQNSQENTCARVSFFKCFPKNLHLYYLAPAVAASVLDTPLI